MRLREFLSTLGIMSALVAAPAFAQSADGPWLSWRGPQQNGTSRETNLVETWVVDGANHLWTHDLAGRGTPVIAGDRLYATGYEGEGLELEEMIVCLDAGTGERIWEHRFADFMSDVIYSRYSISSPVVDADTGNVYVLSTPGLLNCFSDDGVLRWQRSMMEELGRLTFPNGRTGAPVIDGDLAIVHSITAYLGSEGPARDRFFAFDKRTGELVWSSTPGTGPKDSPYSYPVLGWDGGHRVLYAGTGCGHVVCVDARTGVPLWRFQMSVGGVNSSVLVAGDRLVAIHGRENIDSSVIGRMVALERGIGASGEEIVVLDSSHELWRNDLAAFTSSPVLVDDRIYQTTHTGDLACIDIENGKILWHEKLAPDQIHASPVYGDGKLYVPMNIGSFFIIRPSDEGAEILSEVKLDGNCLGAPAIANGRIFVHTTEKLYCFGEPREANLATAPSERDRPAGEAVALQLIPAGVVVRQGDVVPVRARTVDANGQIVDEVDEVIWLPSPRLMVMANDKGEIVVPEDAQPAAGELEASADGVSGKVKMRIVPKLPMSEDFEGYPRTVEHKAETGVMFAFPPSYWTGARLKWEVREVDGNAVLAKTLDRPLFQRTFSFFGHPEMRGYTMRLDVMTDGNRRMMSSAGVINQRYLIVLKGNYQELEISSNMERLKESAAFRWRPKTWYTIESRVDPQPDGSAIVRAKVWPRDEAEPDAWTLEVTDPNGHEQGSPGIYGFSPQSRFRVYLDNLMVTPND